MTEKLRCPYCEHAIDVDMVEMSDLWKEWAELAARLGSTFRLANEYLDSFRRTQDGRLSLKSRIRHLTAIVQLWETETFEYSGKRYRVDKNVIRDALTTVCAVGKFGFRDHNYLKVILVKHAERLSAEGLTAREEKRKFEVGSVKCEKKGVPSALQTSNFELQTSSEKEEFKRKMGELAKNIGRAMP